MLRGPVDVASVSGRELAAEEGNNACDVECYQALTQPLATLAEHTFAAD